jgi:hypothetical protein
VAYRQAVHVRLAEDRALPRNVASQAVLRASSTTVVLSSAVYGGSLLVENETSA